MSSGNLSIKEASAYRGGRGAAHVRLQVSYSGAKVQAWTLQMPWLLTQTRTLQLPVSAAGPVAYCFENDEGRLVRLVGV